MMDQDTLIVECVPHGRKHSVTVRLDGSVLHVDQLQLASASARSKFAKELCERFSAIGKEDLESILLEKAGAAAGATASSDTDAGAAGRSESKSSAELLAETPKDVRAEAEEMLDDSGLISRVVQDVAALGVAGECELSGTIYLIGTSRLLPAPLAGIVQGPSSSGKSHTIGKTGELFPPECVIHATQLTPQALFHMPQGSLVHRFVLAGERCRLVSDEAAETGRALREMLSERRLDKWMPIKRNGEFVTVHIQQDGPIAYVESTTLTKIFDEDLNRCVLLTTDERPEQTRRILEKIAKGKSGEMSGVDVGRIIQRHHAAQRMLELQNILIPYAESLARQFPAERVEARRVLGHLFSMVEASALLHQRQRKTDESGRLIAIPADYQLARYLLAKPIARLLGGRVSDGAKRLHDRMRTWQMPEDFTTKDVEKHSKLSDRAVRGYLSELCQGGYLELVEPGRGQKPHTWRMGSEEDIQEKGVDLPTVEQVAGVSSLRSSDKAQVSFGVDLQPEVAQSAGSADKGEDK